MLEKLKAADGFTFLSLLTGVLAIPAALWGRIDQIALLLVLSAIFDKLDGWFARAVGKANRFGMFLDSLIDVCSFGMVPVVIAFILVPFNAWVILGGVIYLFAGAYRLARYQEEHDAQQKAFKGMPITLNAVLFPALLLVCSKLNPFALPYAIPIYFLASALLMVSDLKVPKW